MDDTPRELYIDLGGLIMVQRDTDQITKFEIHGLHDIYYPRRHDPEPQLVPGKHPLKLPPYTSSDE